MKELVWVKRLLFFLCVLLSADAAFAAVRREGVWPDADKAVTLNLNAVPRAEAVRRLAEAADWNLVFKSLPDDRIDVHVKNQPASRVLDLVLADSNYVARRDGDIIELAPDEAPSQIAPAPAPPLPDPAASATPSKKKHKRNGDSGKDRTMFGGSVRVEKTEVVGDVAVFGGSVDMYGRATGDLTVFGGSVHVYPGARVEGDVAVVGGSLIIDDDATVEGDVASLGGEVKRGPGAKIGGEVKALSDEFDDDRHGAKNEARKSKSPVRTIGAQMTKTALLFMLGAVVIAIATRRMQLLTSEVGLRPLRSLGLGIASVVVGLVLFVVLCVTIVGIPVALAGLLVAIVAGYAGICAALSAVGSAIVGSRSENPYVHLAVGCGVFLIAGLIPYFGGLVTALVLLAGLGAFAATRAAGFIPVNR